MKRLVSLLLVCCTYVANVNAQENFKVTGTVKGSNATGYVYLSFGDRGNEIVDSVEISSGSFTFSGQIQHPVKGTLYRTPAGSSSNRDSKRIYLHAGEIFVETSGSLRLAKISGSDVNAQDAELNTILSNPPGKDIKYNEFIAEAVGGFVKKHPNSFVSLDAIDYLILPIPQDAHIIEPLYQVLSDEIKNSPKGIKTGQIVNQLQSIAIGAQAPDFVQYDVNENEVKLSDFSGQYVLIDFWASWCKPCRAENPVLVHAFERFKQQNFTILGITLDVNKAAWEKAIQEDNLTWKQVGEVKTRKNAAADLYYVQAIPQNFLLDPSGKIVAKNIRGEELEKILEQLL